MRKILFKGKRIDNGGWIYGSPIFQDGYVLIRFWNSEEFEFEEHLIAPESVSEYTGLTDKNGNKIFEGDILDCKSDLYERCKVIYNEFCSAFQLECADGFSDFFLCSINHKKMEIIGNIHDNPELLKESDNNE